MLESKKEAIDEEELEPDEDEAEDEDETVDPVPSEQVESSLDELLAKKEKPETEAAGEADVVGIPPSTREDRVEPLPVKVVPKQENEFTCRNCFLVKHRSQLANKKRMLCRDCA